MITEKKTNKKSFKNKSYNKLVKLVDNYMFEVRTPHSTKAGIRIESLGTKKGSSVELLLPSMALNGIVKLKLTGRQAKSLFCTLKNYYENS